MPEQPPSSPRDPPPSARSAPLDLAIVGGLTIDRLGDGTSAPGGTVLHATLAAAREGLRVGVLTIAGPEALAQRGVDVLRSHAAWVHCQPAHATARFAHDEGGAHRRLWLEEPGERIDAASASLGGVPMARRVLFGPVAGECDRLPRWDWRGSILRGTIVQGWLRGRAVGAVRPAAIRDLDPDVLAALQGLDLVVASREDLAAVDGEAPADSLTALRSSLGEAPLLVLTDGAHGVWIGHPRERQAVHRPVPWVVQRVPTVGAGDSLAVLLLAWMPASPTLGAVVRTADRAMESVAALLQARRSP